MFSSSITSHCQNNKFKGFKDYWLNSLVKLNYDINNLSNYHECCSKYSKLSYKLIIFLISITFEITKT